MSAAWAAGERFVVVGIRVLREGESEQTAFWPLVDTFVTCQPGVMKVLLLDRGFINGPRIGRLKNKYGIDTVIPIRSHMDILQDVRGLTKLDTDWESYEPTHRPSLPQLKSSGAETPHPTVEKREHTRQQTLAAQRTAEAEEETPDRSKVREQTLLARFEGLTSWSDCPVPLTGVLSRDVYADGHTQTDEVRSGGSYLSQKRSAFALRAR